MKKYYKTIIMLAMAVGFFFAIPASLKVMAKTIDTVNASVSSNKITVSGTAETGTVACVVLVYDQSGTSLQAMETCAVAGDNTYSYTLTQDFAAGTYLIKVADYQGGEYAQTTVSITDNTESEGEKPDSKPDDEKPSTKPDDSGNTDNNGSNESGSLGEVSDDNGNDEEDSKDNKDSEDNQNKVSVPVEYTVVKGDTLSKIAYKNHLTLSALLSLNPQIKNPNLIYPGQKIVVGYTLKTVASQNTVVANANASYYTVQKGDFLYRIARKNGLTLAQLGTLNPEVVKQKYIYAGQKIRVK